MTSILTALLQSTTTYRLVLAAAGRCPNKSTSQRDRASANVRRASGSCRGHANGETRCLHVYCHVQNCLNTSPQQVLNNHERALAAAVRWIDLPPMGMGGPLGTHGRVKDKFRNPRTRKRLSNDRAPQYNKHPQRVAYISYRCDVHGIKRSFAGAACYLWKSPLNLASIRQQ